MSIDKNDSPFAPTQQGELAELESIRIAEESPYLNPSAKAKTEAEIEDLLTTATGEEKAELLAAKRKIESEPDDAPNGNNESDPQSNTGLNTGVSLASLSIEELVARNLNNVEKMVQNFLSPEAMGVLADVSESLKKAGAEYNQLTAQSDTTTTQPDTNASRATTADGQRRDAERMENRQVATGENPKAAEARIKLQEKKDLAHFIQEAWDSMKRMGQDFVKNLADIEQGVVGTTGKALKSLVANDPTATAGRIIEARKDGDQKTVRTAQENTHAGAELALLGTLSSPITGGKASPQQQAASMPRMPSNRATS